MNKLLPSLNHCMLPQHVRRTTRLSCGAMPPSHHQVSAAKTRPPVPEWIHNTFKDTEQTLTAPVTSKHTQYNLTSLDSDKA